MAREPSQTHDLREHLKARSLVPACKCFERRASCSLIEAALSRASLDRARDLGPRRKLGPSHEETREREGREPNEA